MDASSRFGSNGLSKVDIEALPSGAARLTAGCRPDLASGSQDKSSNFGATREPVDQASSPHRKCASDFGRSRITTFRDLRKLVKVLAIPGRIGVQPMTALKLPENRAGNGSAADFGRIFEAAPRRCWSSIRRRIGSWMPIRPPAGCSAMTARSCAACAVTALHPGQLPALIVFTEAVMAKGEYWTRGLNPRHAAGRELVAGICRQRAWRRRPRNCC